MSDALNNPESGGGDGVSRRAFLKAASAVALFGSAFLGCERKPRRKIVSQTEMPEYMLPGQPLIYASTWTEGAFPYGILVKTVDGRPIKVDGNPAHPVGGGGSNAAMQAMLLGLYDPDRLAQPWERGRPAPESRADRPRVGGGAPPLPSPSPSSSVRPREVAEALRGRGNPAGGGTGAPSEASAAPSGAAAEWAKADRRVVEALRGARSAVLITRSTLGPSERAIINKLKNAAPALRHFVHESVRDEARRAAWRGLYGGEGDLLPRFGKAKVILSLDSDFLGTDGVVLESAREFAATRRPERGDSSMSRLYVVESGVTPTGAAADHRVRLRPSRMAALARLLLAAVSGESADAAREGEQEREESLADFAQREGCDPATLEALVRDLRAAKGECVVIAGPHLPAPVHATVALLNEALGAHGGEVQRDEAEGAHASGTLEWSAPALALPVSSVAEVEAALADGVDALILLGVNPVYDWPGQDFATLIKKAKLSVAHGLLLDETASECMLALPSAHNLESWNDAAPRPNLRSLCQPVIAPLVNARQEAESLLTWAKALAPGDADLATCQDWHDFVRRQWQRIPGAPISRLATPGTPISRLADGEANQEIGVLRGGLPGSAELHSAASVTSASATSVAIASPTSGTLPSAARRSQTAAPTAFDVFWNDVLRAGIYEIPGAAAAAPPRLDAARAKALSDRTDPTDQTHSADRSHSADQSDPTDQTHSADRSDTLAVLDPQALEIVVRPHHAVWDGRFANNAWLQELPEPVSRIVWDNVAAVSPAWAKSQGLATGDLVDVRVGDFVDVPAGQRSLGTPIPRLTPGTPIPRLTPGTPISRSARTVRLPIHVQPGMPDGVVALTLGHGRAKAGRFGTGVGVNVARLIAPDSKLVAQPPPAVNTSESQRVAQSPSAVNPSESQRVAQSPSAVKESEPGRSAVGGFTAQGARQQARRGYATSAEGQAITPHFVTGATISKTGARYPLVATQLHDSMENRPLALVGTLDQFRQTPHFIVELRHLPEPVQIHTPYPYTGYKWAMAIDLSACQACGACMVACQAENNVASAGKTECGRGHWMHWLRIDRYYAGGDDDPAILHQIMLCQHCEDAPCENVCPVAATTHSPEGINEMTYNRCVGTRYCSNNCPYKVRRFNFFDYAKRFADATRLTLAYNPNVTVRGVGVMEKCNYCIQRINEARAQAKMRDLGTPSAPLRTPISRLAKSTPGPEAPRPVPPVAAFQTACQQACPAGAIVFGDLNDPESAVAKLVKSDRAYRVLEELNTKPRTTYLARIVNPSPGTLAARRIEEIQAGLHGPAAKETR